MQQKLTDTNPYSKISDSEERRGGKFGFSHIFLWRLSSLATFLVGRQSGRWAFG